ncbi:MULTISPECIES: flagellar hook capping FlgD N-terminal domain-containing protein [unclassified Ruegeria]|uniref:flagellar hook capping FlgD N-terminal domain-containing protein n=1 Tax=unclassified Ruegeria TaxID=2625375 RepID=UPI00148949E2|nr:MULTISPECIES: flagellar hook capping FlgD N-terminal domain-containing protein [unclassified Ruegeria]NOD78662.1 flagellar biosynthesis protein FlgD [Ruegeria sp. HKCCD4332]NOD90354.1 flagellar biosynthesis protein FlgD [Ruegeria sp. HKCCD4318]NOE15426.1 flagellar biosynthesis protein FlgD [Ruegeria sp. HKCCD4318-2]NOG10360.1 flagellar biosynthesis protein FlgD [Ruegeria sp. HKCCD4315]
MITPVNTAQAASSQPSANNAQTSAITSDFETFLMMLTAQAQNQDPLEPMDSTQYASQLAQFSMVEQQVQTNDHLSSLASTLGSVNLSDLASWVGMDVRSTSAFHFDGQPKTLFAQADPQADTAKLVIRDENGTVLDKVTVPPAQSEFVWAGVTSSGNPMSTGNYTAALESFKNGELLTQTPVEAYNRVIEAQVGGNTVLLTLSGGEVISASDVNAVRTGA